MGAKREMGRVCAKCGEMPHIKINTLYLCKECFQKQFLAKISKQLRDLPRNCGVLVCLPEAAVVNIFCHATEGFFAQRRDLKVFLLCENNHSTEALVPGHFMNFVTAVAQDDIFGKGALVLSQLWVKLALARRNPEETECDTYSAVIAYCAKQGIRAICMPLPMESCISTSLEFICCGDGTSAVGLLKDGEVEGIRMVNPFSNVKSKELAYYSHVNGIPLGNAQSRTYSKLKPVLRDFLLEIDDKNGLVLFNIMNTLRKL